MHAIQTYVSVEGIINLRGTGQVLLFVPFLGFVLSVLSIKKILWVMGWCLIHIKMLRDARDNTKKLSVFVYLLLRVITLLYKE